MNPSEKAVELAGGASELARIAGVSRQRVYYWQKSGNISPMHCKKIVKGLRQRGHKIYLHDLRPDIWGPNG